MDVVFSHTKGLVESLIKGSNICAGWSSVVGSIEVMIRKSYQAETLLTSWNGVSKEKAGSMGVIGGLSTSSEDSL